MPNPPEPISQSLPSECLAITMSSGLISHEDEGTTSGRLDAPLILPAGKTLQLSKAQQNFTVCAAALVMMKPLQKAVESKSVQGTSKKVRLYD